MLSPHFPVPQDIREMVNPALTSTSAIKTSVHRIVSTLLDLLSVHVGLVMNLTLTESPVMVRTFRTSFTTQNRRNRLDAVFIVRLSHA